MHYAIAPLLKGYTSGRARQMGSTISAQLIEHSAVLEMLYNVAIEHLKNAYWE